jgi:hypothetical protein
VHERTPEVADAIFSETSYYMKNGRPCSLLVKDSPHCSCGIFGVWTCRDLLWREGGTIKADYSLENYDVIMLCTI